MVDDRKVLTAVSLVLAFSALCVAAYSAYMEFTSGA
jgi:hypothetical protein